MLRPLAFIAALSLLSLSPALAAPKKVSAGTAASGATDIAQSAQTEAEGPATAPTPTPAPAAGRRLHGRIKLMTFWEDTLTDPQNGWLVHVRLLIQNDDDVRLYAPDFILTTGGGLGDAFKGLRTRMKVFTNHGLDYPVDAVEDIAACCGDPKRLPADNQIVKVITFFIPQTIPNHSNWKIAWRLAPPPADDDTPSAGPGDAPGGGRTGGARR